MEKIKWWKEKLDDLKGKIEPEIIYEKTTPVINAEGKLEGLKPLSKTRQKTLQRHLERIAELEHRYRFELQYPVQERIELRRDEGNEEKS